MPQLNLATVQDVEQRLRSYLASQEGYGVPDYLRAGGSAAVFKVSSAHGLRAFKVFDPRLFEGPRGAAERRRLNVQRLTIGHSCSSLIETYRVEEAEGTAFMEMEYLDWPSLDTKLKEVPDEKIASLITQLVEASRFLDSKNIVHRDIKPENIHISPDFDRIKLLDLGVARIIESEEDADAGITDHGIERPFLATAQYSSPEYLFRLDMPSPKLWRGLNFYQIGAVLHDLIMKRPIFDMEMQTNNRWLVAKAVLAKQPSFLEENQGRLLSLKALASKCLTKDLESRLNLIDWEDFQFEDSADPRAALASRLAKRKMSAGEHARNAAAARLAADRTNFLTRIANSVRNELLAFCKASLPVRFTLPDVGGHPEILFHFVATEFVRIECAVALEWLNETYERWVNISLAARVCVSSQNPPFDPNQFKPVASAQIDENEIQTSNLISGEIAKALGLALDIIEIHSIDAMAGSQVVRLK